MIGNKVDMPYSKISNLHKKLSKKHGKASMCENIKCKSLNPKRFEWALKKGRNYSDNIDDYMQLCPSCHRLYDYTDDQREKISNAHKGRIKGFENIKSFVLAGIESRKRKVIQLDKLGNFLKEWNTATEAANTLKLHQSSIANNLTNKSKTSGGFIWKYKN